MRVRELRRRARFPDEALASIPVNELTSQHLHRDEPLEQTLAGEIDGSHAALTQQAKHLVLRANRLLEEGSLNVRIHLQR